MPPGIVDAHMTHEAADGTCDLIEKAGTLCFTQDCLSHRQPPFPIIVGGKIGLGYDHAEREGSTDPRQEMVRQMQRDHGRDLLSYGVSQAAEER